MTTFYKFHGTGNDFIMIDGTKNIVRPSAKKILELCHRQTGIGADGLIIVAEKKGYDFEMLYFNSDGSPANMCGNGARCAAAFANMLGIAGDKAIFMAGDGDHTADISKTNQNEWQVRLSMRNVHVPGFVGPDTEINTGTPHFVRVVNDVSRIDTVSEGRNIRYSVKYAAHGINVDWMSIHDTSLKVRTYERGVENETLSCGTGVTACAMVASLITGNTSWQVETPGGKLNVNLKNNGQLFTDVYLTGPAKMVFKGELNEII